MRKQAISVTLEADNLAWLRGRALATGRRSVSETLDGLVRDARAGHARSDSTSVVGTIGIASDDPELRSADEELRRLVLGSLQGVRPRRRAARRAPRALGSGRSSGQGAGRGRG